MSAVRSNDIVGAHKFCKLRVDTSIARFVQYQVPVSQQFAAVLALAHPLDSGEARGKARNKISWELVFLYREASSFHRYLIPITALHSVAMCAVGGASCLETSSPMF